MPASGYIRNLVEQRFAMAKPKGGKSCMNQLWRRAMEDYPEDEVLVRVDLDEETMGIMNGEQTQRA